MTPEQIAQIARQGQTWIADNPHVAPHIAKCEDAKIPGSMDWEQAGILADVIIAKRQSAPVDAPVAEDESEPEEISPRANRARGPPTSENATFGEKAAFSESSGVLNDEGLLFSKQTPRPQQQSLFATVKRSPGEVPSVNIWADGFTWPNPNGAMGVSAVLHYKSAIKEVTDAFPAATGNSNNRAELLAVVHGLAALTRPSVVTVNTDSKYVADGWFTWLNGERRNRPNADLFKEIERAALRHSLMIQWVRRDSDDLNIQADYAARHAAFEFLKPHTIRDIQDWEKATETGKSPGRLYDYLIRKARYPLGGCA